MTDQEDPTPDKGTEQAPDETTEQRTHDQGIGDEGEGSGQTSDEAGGPDEPSEASRRGMPGYQ